MKRLMVAIIALSALVTGALELGHSRMNVVAAQAQAPVREAPKFKVDPAWPKIPSKWVLGAVSSVAVDDAVSDPSEAV